MLISLLSLRPQQRQGHGHRSGATESVYLFRHPLHPTPLTFKTGDMVCRRKTLSKTGRTARPYASVATVFLFTSIIEFTVPRTTSFCSRLLKKGSEGSSYIISFEEKLLGS